ncbi:hypothetical protein FRC17_011291 [Serendipita sp. 399]|nr:hypothetical protein FRC17_011291 [Serendipita sp. 399]
MGILWARPKPIKNIVIVGGSYGGIFLHFPRKKTVPIDENVGLRAAKLLADQLEDHPEYRIIVIDRNSHMNHLYVFPRFSILPGHEFKAFVPYNHIFTQLQSRHLIIQADLLSMTSNSVTISPTIPSKSSFTGEIPKELETEKGSTVTIPFEYAIYALGASLPDPINVWKSLDHLEEPDAYQLHLKVRSFTTTMTDRHDTEVLLKESSSTLSQVNDDVDQDGSKPCSIAWLQAAQRRAAKANSVVIVGGGALGIQIATDTAEVYPDKKITLIHSRDQLMPIYDKRVHEEALQSLRRLNVDVILNERIDMETVRNPKRDEKGRRVIRTISGRTFSADAILLCTGSRANSRIISKGLGRDVVNPTNGCVRVLRTLQVTNNPVDTSAPNEDVNSLIPASESPFPNIFAIGDVADAYGAIKAGHTAYHQGEVTANNITSLVKRGSSAHLQQYQHGPPAIKVTLGIKHYVYQDGQKVVVGDDGVEDLHVALIWNMLGFTGDFDMHQ